MPTELAWTQKKIEETYEFKVEVLGPDKNHCREVRMLNRILRRVTPGIEYEADPRHAELIVQPRG